jgi:hypothetical protein
MEHVDPAFIKGLAIGLGAIGPAIGVGLIGWRHWPEPGNAGTHFINRFCYGRFG